MDSLEYKKAIQDSLLDEQNRIQYETELQAALDESNKLNEINLQKNRLFINNIHYDFIIGRGKTMPHGYRNIPLNTYFNNRNIIYIDPNVVMNADIKKEMHNVDYSYFGISNLQDPNNNINVRFIFDWSSFYCSALYNMNNVMFKIKHKCQILIPLSKNENSIPFVIKKELSNEIYKLALVEGKYPLFNWDDINIMINDIINPERYIIIFVNYE